MKQSRPMLSDELRRLGRWPAYQCRIRTVPGLWRLYMLDVTAYSGRVLGVFVIVLVALGLGLYLRGRTSAQRSSDLFRWMAATAVAMIAFLVLGITYEDWFFVWFLLAGGILVVLAGVWIVLRWRRGTVPQ